MVVGRGRVVVVMVMVVHLGNVVMVWFRDMVMVWLGDMVMVHLRNMVMVAMMCHVMSNISTFCCMLCLVVLLVSTGLCARM